MPDYALDEGARYKVIENSRHLMMPERPAAFAEAVKSCLVDRIANELEREIE